MRNIDRRLSRIPPQSGQPIADDCVSCGHASQPEFRRRFTSPEFARPLCCSTAGGPNTSRGPRSTQRHLLKQGRTAARFATTPFRCPLRVRSNHRPQLHLVCDCGRFLLEWRNARESAGDVRHPLGQQSLAAWARLILHRPERHTASSSSRRDVVLSLAPRLPL